MKKDTRIISVATTGSWPSKQDNPNLPVSPEEIARDIYECYLEGAAVAHIHVRDEKGAPSMKTEYFARVAERLSTDHPDCDMILNFTTSGGVAWSEEQRMAPALSLRPEMATFDCGSMNWRRSMVFDNNPRFLDRLGRALTEAGIKPEVEVFHSGMLEEALYYLKTGALQAPLHFQFCLGVPGGASATVKELLHLWELLPEDATWSAFGVGRGAMEIMYAAIALGGNIRVGMEDNVRFDREHLAKSNAQLVARARQALELYGCCAATPAQARAMLGIGSAL